MKNIIVTNHGSLTNIALDVIAGLYFAVILFSGRWVKSHSHLVTITYLHIFLFAPLCLWIIALLLLYWFCSCLFPLICIRPIVMLTMCVSGLSVSVNFVREYFSWRAIPVICVDFLCRFHARVCVLFFFQINSIPNLGSRSLRRSNLKLIHTKVTLLVTLSWQWPKVKSP